MRQSTTRVLASVVLIAIEVACGDNTAADEPATGSSGPLGSSDGVTSSANGTVEDSAGAGSTSMASDMPGGELSTTTETAEDAGDDVSLDLPPQQDCSGYANVYMGSFAADDDDDVATLAGVTCIEGDLALRMDVTDLSDLLDLEAVGSIQFSTLDLVSFDGLDSLREIRRTLSFGAYLPDAGCVEMQIATIAPLAALEELGELFVCNNPNLTSIAELETALTGDFPGPIHIVSAPSLQSLDGLQGLTSAGHGLALTDLPLVPDLEPLGNLGSVEGSFTLGGLTSLTSLEGLEQVTHAGSLLIVGNAQLTTLAGFDNLAAVGENLSIHDNPMLPHDEAEAWAAALDVGTTITICNNLGGPPC